MTHGFHFQSNPKHKKAPGKTRNGSLMPHARPDGEAVTIANVRNKECRWPYGDESADMVMCGRTVDAGSPYCVRHHALSSGGHGGKL